MLQVRVAPSSRNSAWAAFDGRNRREIKQGDRSGAKGHYHITFRCGHTNITIDSYIFDSVRDNEKLQYIITYMLQYNIQV